MLSILINAYACSPNMGSEPGMAWNWCVNLAKYCELYIITEGEFRDNIENALCSLPYGQNMHFYYNPVPEKVRKMCWNQGDWRFYWYYKQWQKKTLAIAKNIIAEHKIDIVHQLNMVGFREPGYLWKIENIPFVWGPIGGMENIPLAYIDKTNIKTKLKVVIKQLINEWQIRHARRVRLAIKRASLVIGATKGSVEKVKKYYNRDIILVNETGCSIPENMTSVQEKLPNEFHIIWVGRFLFTKKLDLALDVIASLKHLKGIKFHIVGSGNEFENISYRAYAQKLHLEDICVWHGNVSNAEVQNLMRQSDLFFFTSIMEATSTVIMEAISNGLPIVCFDICGFGPIVSEQIGRKIALKDPETSINEFSKIIESFYYDRKLINQMSNNCALYRQNLTWNSKMQQMLDVYCNLVEKGNVINK